MILSGINLRKELEKHRSQKENLLTEAHELLLASAKKDEEVLSLLNNGPNNKTYLHQPPCTENIFSIDDIKKICVRYRLRFLNTSYFNSAFPYEAIMEINAFEKKYGMKINSFHIIAPSKAFDLENINKDPILFAKLNENSFYLLHQWGNDLAWYRKVLTWPLKSFKTLMISILIACFIFAFSLPSSIMNIFSFENEIYLRLWLTIHCFIGILGLSLWAGLSFDKTFSVLNWDSKYYNY